MYVCNLFYNPFPPFAVRCSFVHHPHFLPGCPACAACLLQLKIPRCLSWTIFVHMCHHLPHPDISSLQGYLSFWNDSISYALRGCILIELALRRRIALVKDSNQRRTPLADRLVEVIDDKQTGETILDEALKMMKGQETDRMSINGWVDLLSGASRIFQAF
jgi:hypothetical protein